MFVDMPLKEFIEKVSSSKPVPGGGSVAALCATLSIALIEMVLRLTTKNKDSEVSESQISTLIDKASHLKEELTKEIDRDARAFANVMEAYRLPKGTELEKKVRLEAIEKALKEATIVPMEVAEKAFQLLELSRYVVQYGNRNAITDSAVSAILARGAAIAALYNVRINLASIKDGDFKKEMEIRSHRLEKDAIKEEQEILKRATRIMTEAD